MTRFNSVAEVLRHAAERAATERGLEKAVRTAWQSLHLEPSLMPACFDAWRAGERFTPHATQLGGMLLRRYQTPADIAASLLRSADLAEQPEGSDRLCGEPIEGEPEPCALRAGHRSSEHLSANVIGWQRALGGPLPADDLPPEGSDRDA